jgi:hypothetical protein
MIVVAVEHLDIDTRVRPPARQLPRLARHGLLQPLNDDIPHR